MKTNKESRSESSFDDRTIKPLSKPFFVMDWLEEVNPDDLELARKMLQTPQKSKLSSVKREDGINSIDSDNSGGKSRELPYSLVKDKGIARSELYPPNNDTPKTRSRCRSSQELCAESSVETSNNSKANINAAEIAKRSPFHKKSIAIGNGWNAKGLQKAKKGRWEDAIACWENSLEIRSQVLGEDHTDVANTCNNIGIAVGKLHRYDEATTYLQRALRIRVKIYGHEHSEVAATLHNIGNVLHQSRDWKGAIQAFFESKLLQEKVLGYNHVQVARTCVAIGHVYYEVEQFVDALQAFSDALDRFEKAGFASNDPEVEGIAKNVSEIEIYVQEWRVGNQ